MKTLKAICPVCGTKITLEQQTNEGIRNAAQPVPNKAEDRLDALRKAGVDTTNLFAMRGAAGNGMIARLDGGMLTVLDENDPIFQTIMDGGTIPDRSLFRRWVMSQMFHMLTAKDGYTAALRAKGYEYQWSMLLEELRVQARLYRNDKENYYARNRWFNAEVCNAVIEDYENKLGKYISSLKVKSCKGIPYITLHGMKIFSSDVHKTVFKPLHILKVHVAKAKNPDELYKAMCKYNGKRFKLPFNTLQCSAWDAAYKGAGAYFTLTNLIRFHYCWDRSLADSSEQSSLNLVEYLAIEYKNEGWRLLAYLREFLIDNNFCIEDKMREWAMSKRQKDKK